MAEEAGPRIATFIAPTNIAVIKYWGKRDSSPDPALNLPINSSVSLTLDTADLKSVTTAMLVPDSDGDRLWLNGREDDAGNKRFARVLSKLRELCKDEAIAALPVHVASYNTFPTAAGLASSASGYACLAAAVGKLLCPHLSKTELSAIARQGSGSACRSLFGGMVEWSMGVEADGSDSVAVPVAPREHWPEMEALICVVSDAKKDVASTAGMQLTVDTSPFVAHRADAVVPARMEEMRAAYLAKDFAKFAELTMRDSNSFHATCLDTFPPIFYLTDVSKDIIRVVHRLNAASDCGPKVAYTFDAGPNAVLFLRAEHVEEVAAALVAIFPPAGDDADFTNDVPLLEAARGRDGGADLGIAPRPAGSVSYMFHTRVGEGATEVDYEPLLDPATGLPQGKAAVVE
eukprot:PLAT3591.3.p1 GENE.PLAT3591.3~~PLAT3591.3.p1  ORF type:complete len:403 (+),score=176.08 PLAT3591.3:298-1506(+)